METKKIILASTSPRRIELLKNLKLDFTAVASDYEEDMTINLEPPELAKYLSRGKGMAVVDKYDDHIIISADTFVVLKNELLGKPHTEIEAKKMLEKVSSQSLQIITGFTVINSSENIVVSKVVETTVCIKKLSDREIDGYIKSGEPMDKAGAFAVQGLGAVFIKKIDGDYTSVIGLPLHDLAIVLKEFGILIP